MNRRDFFGATLAAAVASTASPAPPRRPRIVLRSSWQVVNIGDIAHTPGVLALMERHLPEADVVLWASGDLTDEVAAMEHRRFPKLQIVKGSIRDDGRGSNPELDAALRGTDFLLHGSGPSLVAYKDLAAFARHIDKPYGIYGITYGGADAAQRQLISQAGFAFFRDSASLDRARQEKITCPIMDFAPDGAFACDLRNDAAATAFLREHGLHEKKFLCCIPRLRFTPYWLIRKGRMLDPVKQQRNEEMKEHDHAPLRDAIAAVVRQTGHKVLVCPEDMTQMQVGREMIIDKLPPDVRKNVVWREQFWLTDEALSTYLLSAGLFGLEMHSPIMCIGNGVPAIVCRFSEQTTKGLMWRDIGLNDWLFDMDVAGDVSRIVPAVLSLLTDPQGAMEKVARARQTVTRRQQESMQIVQRSARAAADRR